MTRKGIAALVAAALALAGLGIGVGLAAVGSSSSKRTVAGDYSFYRSMLGSYDGSSMMGGGSYGWMMGSSGYRWMIGGIQAPGWMSGGVLPSFMMGSITDPGRVMGRFWANAPGPRVSLSDAYRLGSQTPVGAQLDRAARTISFTPGPVHLVVLASPSMPTESFRIAGLTDPTIYVAVGAKVTIELINADTDMAHGLVVTARSAASLRMPMMGSRAAFPGAALWLLGEATPAGLHEGTLSFTASRAGTYKYLCPVPGHAEEGMAGTLIVVPSS